MSIEYIDLCLSGGADGADTEWGLAAQAAGHQVIHWSFNGHKKINLPNVYILTEEQLLQADDALKVANNGVKRSFPGHNNHVNNLLRRNYWQIIESNSVYAVTRLVGDKSELAIAGGTAWACQLYVDKCRKSGEVIQLYVFDQTTSKWLIWSNEIWETITNPPIPKNIYAGIGSRELTAAGKKAIWDVFKS